MFNDAADREWQQWQRVCAALKKAGAVTEVDLKTSARKRGTPGLDLLHEIHEWGQAMRELGEKRG